MSDDLIKWFAEENGFSQGTKAPHKWVLQAEQELRIQATALAAAHAEIARLTARAGRMEAALRRLVNAARAWKPGNRGGLLLAAAVRDADAALTDKPDAGEGE